MSKRKTPLDKNVFNPPHKRQKINNTNNIETTILHQQPNQITDVSGLLQRLDKLEHGSKKIQIGINQIDRMEKNIERSIQFKKLQQENIQLKQENIHLKKQTQQIHKIYNNYQAVTQKNQALVNENINLKQQIAQLKEQNKNNPLHTTSPSHPHTDLLNEFEPNRNAFHDNYSIHPTISPPPYNSINSINNLSPTLFNTRDQDDDFTHTVNTSPSFKPSISSTNNI